MIRGSQQRIARKSSLDSAHRRTSHQGNHRSALGIKRMIMKQPSGLKQGVDAAQVREKTQNL